MSLIYLWIGRFNNIKEQGFLIDNKYHVGYKYEKKYKNDGDYSIIGTEFKIESVGGRKKTFSYGKNIESIHAFVGKNGSGKSSILKLLSTPYQEMKGLDASYFAVYATKKSGEYIIEGNEFEYDKLFGFKNIIAPFCIKFNVENGEQKYIQDIDENEIYNNSISMLYKDSISEAYNSDFDIFNARLTDRYYDVDYAALYMYVVDSLYDIIKKDNQYYNSYIDIRVKVKDDLFLYKDYVTDVIFKRNVEQILRRSTKAIDEELKETKRKMLENIADAVFGVCAIHFFKKNVKEMLPEKYINALMSKHKEILGKKYDSDEKFEKAIEEELKNPRGYKDQSMYQVAEEIIFDSVYEYLLKEFEQRCKPDIKIKELIFQIIDFYIEIMDFEIKESKLMKYWYTMIEGVNDKDHISKKHISVLIRDENKIGFEFLKRYQEIKMIEVDSSIDYILLEMINMSLEGVSDGENYFLRLFSRIRQDIKKIPNRFKNVTLLFDEIELYLHPEWCRMIMDMLIKEVKQYDNINFTILLATHSPFIISDIQREHIHILNVDDSGNVYENKEAIQKSFAANIHTLFRDGMFMSSTVGEFSKNKINEVIKELEEAKILGVEALGLKNKHENIIDSIGDDLLRNLLKNEFEKVYKENKYENNQERIIEELESMSLEEKKNVKNWIERNLNNDQD